MNESLKLAQEASDSVQESVNESDSAEVKQAASEISSELSLILDQAQSRKRKNIKDLTARAKDVIKRVTDLQTVIEVKKTQSEKQALIELAKQKSEDALAAAQTLLGQAVGGSDIFNEAGTLIGNVDTIQQLIEALTVNSTSQQISDQIAASDFIIQRCAELAAQIEVDVIEDWIPHLPPPILPALDVPVDVDMPIDIGFGLPEVLWMDVALPMVPLAPDEARDGGGDAEAMVAEEP